MKLYIHKYAYTLKKYCDPDPTKRICGDGPVSETISVLADHQYPVVDMLGQKLADMNKTSRNIKKHMIPTVNSEVTLTTKDHLASLLDHSYFLL